MTNAARFLARWLPPLCALLASCTSTLHMPADELATLARDEGRVFGSVEIVVAPSEVEPARERSGGLLGLLGADSWTATDAAEVDFEVTFVRKGSSSGRSLAVRAGAPEAYAARLEQGEYGIRVSCSQASGSVFDLESPFQLAAGETIYLGRLQLLVPAEVGALGTLPFLDRRVSPQRSADMELLGDGYRAVLPAPFERLLR